MWLPQKRHQHTSQRIVEKAEPAATAASAKSLQQHSGQVAKKQAEEEAWLQRREERHWRQTAKEAALADKEADKAKAASILPPQALTMGGYCKKKLLLPPLENSTAMGLGKDPKIHVFGLYGTGTNVIQTVLHEDLVPRKISVCPDTKVRMHAVKEKACHGPVTSKHSNPKKVWKWLRTAATKAVFIIRSPFSWLRSVMHTPYQLRKCIKKGWWKPCSCTSIQGHDPLCDVGRTHYSNVMDIWKQYGINYYKIMLDPAMRGRVAMVAYRDLILRPDCTLSSVGKQLGAKRRKGHSRGEVLRSMSGRSKQGGGHQGGLGSVMKDLRDRVYLRAFPKSVRIKTCKALKDGFPKALSPFLKVDC